MISAGSAPPTRRSHEGTAFRKARHYFPARRNVARSQQDSSARDAQISVAALELVEQRTPATLQARLATCTALLAQADQDRTLNPGP
jgi:hypothetical protein